MKLDLTIIHMGKYENNQFHNVTETLNIDTEQIKYRDFSVFVNHLCISWINIVETTENNILVYEPNPHKIKKILLKTYPFTLTNNVYLLSDETTQQMIDDWKYDKVNIREHNNLK